MTALSDRLVVTVWLLAWAALIAPASGQIERQKPSVEPDKKPQEAKQDDGLAGKLMRKAINESDEDLMDAIMRLMGDVSRKLTIDFDPSEQTQTTQREISSKLDDAIKTAASRRRMRMVNPRPQGPDKRKLPSTVQRPETGRAQKQGETSDASKSGSPPTSTQVKSPPPGGELRDARRGWGNLPDRERDEVIQGIEEEFLERYRMWIERYYRSLQESDR